MFRRPMLVAALALASATAPLGAQSVYSTKGDGYVTVQNNRDVPVTVYLDSDPVEKRLGKVEAMRTATLPLPKWAARGREQVKLLIQPLGQLPLEAVASVTEKGPRFALLIPSTPGQDTRMPGERLAAVLPVEYLDAATVTVRNHRDEPADVFIQRGSLDTRLGRVEAMSEQTFRIPDRFVGQKGQVLVVPVEGTALASWDIQLEEGAHFGVLID